MDSKEATEEFIRRESKAEMPDVEELELESSLPDVGLESQPDPELLEPECRRSITRTEFDAVHPRFQIPKQPEVMAEFQRANYYYCEQCKLYFAPTIMGLKTHFKGDMVKHQRIDDCFYCNGPVYAYSFNTERQIYHNCKDADSEVAIRQEVLIENCSNGKVTKCSSSKNSKD